MEEIKQLLPLSPIPATPSAEVLEQTYHEEVWPPNKPATIDELMGQIPDWLLKKMENVSPCFTVVCWSTQHQTTGFITSNALNTFASSLQANKKYTCTYKQ